MAIYLPESFEWIILSSGVVTVDDNEKISSPELFADSVDFMSENVEIGNSLDKKMQYEVTTL